MEYLLAVAACCATLLGGVVAVRAKDRLHLVLGLAAGILLGVAAFDLLPEALDQQPDRLFGVPVAMLATVAGFFTVHVLERSLAIHRGHEKEFTGHSHGMQSVGLLAGGGLIVHSTLDGIGIGIGYQVGHEVGLAVAVAVIAHDFADGFNTFTITSLYGNARSKALMLLGLDALAPVAGVLIGSQLSLPTSATGVYLGYFAGFLLYLATSDILPEAHARHASRMTLVCTVGGAALMWLVVGASR